MSRSTPFGVMLAVLLALLAPGRAVAGSDLNEVGAFLVFPAVFALSVPTNDLETYLAIVNTDSAAVTAHVSFINGLALPGTAPECYECDFNLPLTGNDTELLIVRVQTGAGFTLIESEDRTVSHGCDQVAGFVTVSLENAAGNSTTSNVLLGSEVIVDYTNGMAFSLPAIPFQGKLGGDGDRDFGFDDVEYGKLPRYVAADFLAPDFPNTVFRGRGGLIAFTLNFERGRAPRSSCTVTGYDAAEHPFSRGFSFGCWGIADLCSISSEFCYPNLGSGFCQPYTPDPDFDAEDECDTHGWMKLDCRVREDPNAPPAIADALGGVHGVIIQYAPPGSRLRRNDPTSPTTNGWVAWGRALYQSVTAGDAVTLMFE